MNIDRASLIRERRFVPDTEVRLKESDSGPVLEGYAAVFGSWSVDLGGFREKIAQGAFKKTIKEADVRGLVNHNSDLIFGRTKAKTLELREDDKGLVYSSPLDTQISYVSDLVRSIDRGDISGNSFAFRTIKDSWVDKKGDGPDERELVEVELFDVGPVTYPAYPATSLDLRSGLRNDVDMERLSYVLFRLERGLTLEDKELEFIENTIDRLRSCMPRKASEPGPVSHSDEDVEPNGDHSEEPAPDHSRDRDQRLCRELLDVEVTMAAA